MGLPVLFDLLLKLTWELRSAWATGRRVALTLERCDMERVEGIVTRVSPTAAFATIGSTHVPLDRVLAVHWPSVLGDGHSTARGVGHRKDLHPEQMAWSSDA